MPEVSNRRVFILGDSMSSGASSPGGVLAKQLTAAGATVKVNAKVGRSAWNFYGSEDAAAQLAAASAWRPHLAIVQLGTNDIGLSLSVDRNRMIQLRDDLARGGADVWALGPPAFAAGVSEAHGVDAVAAMMKDVFGSRFIDMRSMTKDLLTTSQGRATDGVHFTADGGGIAGRRAASAFMNANDAGITLLAVLAAGVLAWVMLR